MSKLAKNIVSGIIVLALLVGIIIGSIALAQNVDFRVKQPEEKTEQSKDQTYTDDVIISESGNNGALKLSMSKIIPIAGTATPVGGNHMSYKLTAELTPASTTDKLDLELSGADASKITLDHEDGAFEATLTVNEAFANTVTLTGTIRNRDITDSINIDYLAKPKSINNGANPVNLDNFSETFQLKMTDRDYEVGSVKPTKITGTVTLSLPTNVYNALKNKGWADLQRTKSFDYNLLAPTDLKANVDQFMSRTLESTELKNFNYDLYWVLEDILDGDPLVMSYEFDGNYYAMVNGVETNCGHVDGDNGSDLEISSYADLQTPANNMDLGPDILFY